MELLLDKNLHVEIIVSESASLRTEIRWSYEIIYDCERKSSRIKLEIVKRWIRGSGRMPISWKTLADVVDSMGLKVLAKIVYQTT